MKDLYSPHARTEIDPAADLAPARSPPVRVHPRHRPPAPHIPQRHGVARRRRGEERVGLRRQL